ncbi:MAG TPA: winged helix-turn-helix domain-containing protein [Actinomycetota bacterium]|nr:winged helix-turn-helix domain-containing protein [Actinomycetota bacterium]
MGPQRHRPGGSKWRFLTNHAVVLICIVRNPNSRLKEIAEKAGITERSTRSIIRDLAEAGYVEIARRGRRNTYGVHSDLPMRHPLAEQHSIGELLLALAEEDGIDPHTGASTGR